ncbi:bifunctional diguanylate cyclase/phosphodiesterase [Hydrogenovibrio sp. JE_KL2]|uniref:bifunctional diguanylate cyclase/phosphodiesterase n=1 Tax=Hydrogenovibrio sp. JE_KL2 TaxID=2651188 RepID=UPI00128DABE9|nr:bifunctional diguanylate cyclase/phosphodiesterase [Hydrogenovibrio sp. JE_KL2]MPQ75596.1 bifunctional diguanylate cyclase/phosphodiesterase [Hydrogenovibrio sp. JE_KL2]
MKLPLLTAKVYLAVFVLTMLGIYSFFHFQLYSETESLRSLAQIKTEALAKKELQHEIVISIDRINQSLDQITYWDDLYQQLTHRDGFQIWYRKTLKTSRLWRKNYLQLQLYNENGHLVAASPDTDLKPLPNTIPNHPLYFLIWHGKLVLIQFKPIYKPYTKIITGYTGLATDFLPELNADEHLTHIKRGTLKLNLTKNLSTFLAADLPHYVSYQIPLNPMNEYLWGLIQNFLIQVAILGLLISLMFVILFAHFIMRPLHQMTGYIERLKNSPNKLESPLNKRYILKEFERLKDAIYHYHKQIVSANIEIEEQRQIAHEQARVDALSHVMNRRAFEENWLKIIQNYPKNPRNIAFLLFDCDFFKAINDTYGHEVGDEIIRISASTIKRALPLDADLYRLGGDEFAAIVKDRSPEESIKIAEKCYEAISKFNFEQLLGINEKVVFSIGISIVTPDIANEVYLMNRQADIALYRAKKSLQKKISVYEHEAEFEEAVLLSKKYVNAIVESLQCNNSLQIYGQSIVSLTAENASYKEALVRIKADDTLIQPVEILKVVHHRNLEIELDQCVLSTILTLLTQNKIPSGMGLSINISVQTLLQGNLPSLLVPFKRFLPEHKLVIEILESTLITNIDQVTETLNSIRSQGFKVALDDFGSGYSSIKYLSWMPVDIVKFDMTLTRGLLSDDKTKNIIEKTAAMIRSAGYDLVMEGIETEEMKQAAIAAGATHLQGYLFDKPSPLSQD